MSLLNTKEAGRRVVFNEIEQRLVGAEHAKNAKRSKLNLGIVEAWTAAQAAVEKMVRQDQEAKNANEKQTDVRE